MPTTAEARYPEPASWIEFENICKDSFELKWNTPHLVKHGRQGQKQYGVDIYANLLGDYYGIQCKNTLFHIDEKLIMDECANAENFSPYLKQLYIATTSPRDAKIQQYIRTLNIEREKDNRFLIEIIFWDDIIQDLCKSENVLKKHYPQFFQDVQPISMERDLILLKKYCERFNFDYQVRLKNENFGARVPRDLVDNIVDFYFYEGNNPDWCFNDPLLESYRIAFLESIGKFQKHFKEQSGGMINYYDFVDLHKWYEHGDKTYQRGLQYVHEMQELSYNVAEKILDFLNEKKNRGLY